MIKEENFIIKKLIDKNVLTMVQKGEIEDYAAANHVTLFKSIIEQNILTKDKLYDAISETFNIDKVDVNVNSLDVSILDKTTSVFMNEYRIIPTQIVDGVVIAIIDDVANIIAAFTLQNQYGMPVHLNIVEPNIMDDLLKQITYADRRNKAIDDLGKESKEVVTSDDDLSKYLSAPTVALANTLLEEAVSLEASDIHIEPMENEVRVRYRIDGVLIEHCRIALNLYQALLARYKIMSQLDIAERRIPQDGKISMTINGHEFDFRISTLPVIYGEKIVIRIYNALGNEMTVSKLASDKEDERKIRNLIRSPHGIILLTGPTGSGKTTTLYAFLKELNKPGVNIQTVEDPVENQVAGTNQVQVNTKQGLTFAAALRSILRQDPNILMIGEIRDEETAHIAVQAAITGHLVFSTIHTNDAVTTIARLIDMGVEPYLVSDSLAGAISQRLMRRLCPFCKKEHIINTHESKILGIARGTKIFEQVGCPKCNNTGYKGRVAVFEIMEMNKNVKIAIDEKKFGGEDLQEAALKDGLIPLRTRAANLVKEGLTSIEEFNALVSHVGED